MLNSWIIALTLVSMTESQQDEFCTVFGELARYWVQERDAGLTKIEIEMQAAGLIIPEEFGGNTVVNTMFADLMEYVFSYPYPSIFDAQVEASIMCNDAVIDRN